ncbi:MAG: calcium/sodium antiporter [Bacteroidales bacterium]|nr:calcium/sodium antiporter [Bacteroidales bacterium]
METGPLILNFVLLIFSFVAMHVVSERYFIESLDFISRRLRLSSDMAGSTLMAAGSSAPELAVALFSVLMAGNHEAIGVGTIVGSALFNILVITGFVMYLKSGAKLMWQPILRDIIFYIIAIILLGITFLNDDVSLWGAVLLIGTYVVYVIVVYFWKRVFPYHDTEDEPEKTKIPVRDFHPAVASRLKRFEAYLLRFPFVIFMLSIALISLLSWLLVHSAVHISQTLGVPELLIGITIVAVGTSVPDLISSVIVARQGRPGMAINNAIGSNTFDILVGLGLPFLIYSVIREDKINLRAEDLVMSISILLGTSLLLLLYFFLSKWRTSLPVGILLLLMYIVYLAYVICTASC